MSWWETGKEQATIGDIPADTIKAGLKKIAKARLEDDKAKPSLAQLLSSLAEVLKQRDSRASKLVARTSRGVVAAEGPEDSALQAELGNIVDAITKDYGENLERKPQTGEILACFLFVLGFEPERFLSNVDGLTIDAIAVA